MSEEFHSALISPKGIWWKPAEAQEKRWIIIAFVWFMVLFAMMPLWHIKGGQNPTGIRAKVDPAEFAIRTARHTHSGEPRLMAAVLSAREGARMPTEKVMQASTASPWCGTPGGR